jgi:transcriptional regulator with XRE-family HTH domain
MFLTLALLDSRVLTSRSMRLSQYLAAHGIRQAEFARRAGISRAMICQILSGVRLPGLFTAQRIEKATDGEVRMDSWKAPSRRRVA